VAAQAVMPFFCRKGPRMLFKNLIEFAKDLNIYFNITLMVISGGKR